MGKKNKNKNRPLSRLDHQCYYLKEQLGQGLTLEEVAVERSVDYSELISEINEHPRLVQALKDGKAAGKAYWQKELKIMMMDNGVSASLAKVWFGNYMSWWGTPLPEEFDENTIVNITIKVRKPTKEELRGTDNVQEIAETA